MLCDVRVADTRARPTPQSAHMRTAALERSVRALIARGGCRMVAASWKERTLREESFLGRMRDLGRVLPTVRFAKGVCVGALQVGSRE